MPALSAQSAPGFSSVPHNDSSQNNAWISCSKVRSRDFPRHLIASLGEARLHNHDWVHPQREATSLQLFCRAR